MKIAIIGSGISGLTCAHHLNKDHNISVFEAADYIGGHTNTIEVGDKRLPVDTGFIVFNQKTYPNFVKLLTDLNVEYQPTSMSFSVKCDHTGLEYNGTSLNTLFAQRLNLFSPRFHRLIRGILKFNRAAKDFLENNKTEQTFRQFVDSHNLPSEVTSFYIIPMAAAVWSANPLEMWSFPARFMLNFWKNHGFLEINDRPQWYVIKGGSFSYVKKIIEPFASKIRLGCAVDKVERTPNGVIVTSGGTPESFDKVIFATHSDQALSILENPSARERDLLTSIPYQENEALLHTDASILPKKRLAWAAWNYHLPKTTSNLATVTYNMNILQSLDEKEVFNVSLNCPYEITKDKVIKKIKYHHPVFTIRGVQEQENYASWMGENNTLFCGAYLRNGFHEDGVVTAQRVCRNLGVQI